MLLFYLFGGWYDPTAANQWGVNCRMFHTFCDEDSMRWMKGVLQKNQHTMICARLLLSLPWYGLALHVAMHVFVGSYLGILAKAHPRTRCLWLMKCTKLRQGSSLAHIWHARLHQMMSRINTTFSICGVGLPKIGYYQWSIECASCLSAFSALVGKILCNKHYRLRFLQDPEASAKAEQECATLATNRCKNWLLQGLGGVNWRDSSWWRKTIRV